MTKTITLLASGTRGDVQPCIALGIGLRNAGFDVRVAAHDAFADFVRAWNLEFVSLGENPSDLFYRVENQDALRAGSNLIRTMRASWNYWRAARPVYVQLVERAWLAAHNSDALIYGLPTFWANALGDALRIPHVRAFMQPLTPTRAFPCPLLPISRTPGAAVNHFSYTFCFTLMRFAWRDALRAWQKKFRIPRAAANAEMPTLYAFSEHLVPRPRDYPPQHLITGYWFLPERAWTPPRALGAFLHAGDAPLYFGLGSARTGDAAKLRAVLLDAQHATGLRFFIPQILADASLPREMFCAIGDVPHEWLFPRVCAVLHHGGAGTTAAALRAGLPQLITPIASDSYFWGERVFENGVGARPLPEAKLTADVLSDTLQQIVGNKTIRARAETVARGIAREQGVTRAIKELRVLV